ncbi:MAG: T9SS type A sorting domain-containing protein [Polaribacter sp.]|nr:T9SS type A sorting domain-containing protein [Polaribacter sp.]
MKNTHIFILFLALCVSAISLGQNAPREKSIDGFFVYPNPVSKGSLTIKTSQDADKEILIYNVLGKQVFTRKFKGNTKRFDISNIRSGIYIMKVIEGDKIETKKLVIK